MAGDLNPEEQSNEMERLRLGLGDHVPERYRDLFVELYRRIPDAEQAFGNRTFSVEVKRGPSRGYARVFREDEAEVGSEQLWLLTLYPDMLKGLPDAAVRWALAHELAHIAVGMPTGSVVLDDGVPQTRVGRDWQGTDIYEPAPPKANQEDAADIKAMMEWGFAAEYVAFKGASGE